MVVILLILELLLLVLIWVVSVPPVKYTKLGWDWEEFVNTNTGGALFIIYLSVIVVTVVAIGVQILC